jgi:hypothetical protein
MHDIMPDQQPPAEAPRGLHEICEDARHERCGAFCGAMPGEECTTAPVSVPVTETTAMLPVRGYHVARFAWAEASGLISAADFDAVLATLGGSFTSETVIYDRGPEEVMSGAEDKTARPLGREALFDLLKRTMHAAGVSLGGWDWTVLRWLADQDAQTVAAIAGWVGRSTGDYDDSPGLEPYCADCGGWIGMFFGLDGWQHFRGDPAPGGQRQLFDAGHQASPAWCEPPGRAISPADAATIRRALADAESTRRDQTAAWCGDCQGHPAGACDQHVDDLDQANSYRDLAHVLSDTEDGR